MLRIACVLLLATVFYPAQAAAQTYTLSGTVVEHGSNRPLKDVVVTIAPVQQTETSFSYRTGEDGHFVFPQLSSGKFSLSAEKRGFPHQLFEEDQQYSTAIAIGPDLDSANIVFPLSPGGTITGTVLDEENDPVNQALVLLFRKAVSAGSLIALEQQHQTDSSGQFRFPHLKPGTYFVAVQAHPWYARNGPPQAPFPGSEQTTDGGELDVAYPLTYYSGSLDPASASPITVTEGGASSLQMVLRPVPALHVQLTGVGTEPGHGVGVNVMQVGLGGHRSFSQGQVSFGNGVIEISGIAPGRYVLTPNISGEGRTERIGSAVFDFTGNTSIDISAFGGMPVTGHLTFEGDGPTQRPLLLLHQLGARAQSFLSIEPDGTLQQARGSFLLPGRYQLSLRNLPGFYLKSVEANGVAVSSGEIDIPTSGSVQLSLVAAKGLTSINGIAVKDNKPVAGAMVLLIPKNFSRADFIRRDQSDSDGTFALPDVPPGRYTLLAIDNGHDLLYQDSSVMKPYLSEGQDLTAPVASGSAVKVSVLHR